jgi:hypothetical protein
MQTRWVELISIQVPSRILRRIPDISSVQKYMTLYKGKIRWEYFALLSHTRMRLKNLEKYFKYCGTFLQSYAKIYTFKLISKTKVAVPVKSSV